MMPKLEWLLLEAWALKPNCVKNCILKWNILHYHMVKLIQNAVDNGCFCFDIPTQSSQDTSFVIKGTRAVKIAGINRKWKRKKGSFWSIQVVELKMKIDQSKHELMGDVCRKGYQRNTSEDMSGLEEARLKLGVLKSVLLSLVMWTSLLTGILRDYF